MAFDPTHGDTWNILNNNGGSLMPDLGKVAYEAYAADAGGVSAITGDPLPGWEEQNPVVQGHWEAAGEAVRVAVIGPPFHYGPADAAGSPQ